MYCIVIIGENVVHHQQFIIHFYIFMVELINMTLKMDMNHDTDMDMDKVHVHVHVTVYVHLQGHANVCTV